MIKRILYTAFLYCLLPYIFFHLLWRARKQPGYLWHIGERFGFYRKPVTKPIIWLHAVSVGETRAAGPLLASLKRHYPEYDLLITHTTPTGRETGLQLFGNKVMRCYLPYDFPFAVKRFLRHYKPMIGNLMETEIWFNLIHHATKAGIPMLLVNARMSEKSTSRYRRFRGLTAQTLKSLSAIAAQTVADSERLQALGAENIEVTGNLKFDARPPSTTYRDGQLLRKSFGQDRHIFLAASTREGEEKLILDAIKAVPVKDLLTVIVPRHPNRFDEVAQLLLQQQIKFQRRSQEHAIDEDTKIVLGDSMGELFNYYAACDVAFVGGSLLPLGGQNLIEACAMGVPVLIGPHTFNFAEATRGALKTGAALTVKNSEQLAQKLTELLNDSSLRTKMGKAGIDFSTEHQGAADKILKIIEGQLAKN